jgi:S-DNA-T family DNA segregation ATPase FtsK/SpoIIIE
VGLVTDLDEHLTRRALRSLDAELKRRKTILAAAGCKDIEDYLAQNLPAHQARAPLPRLLLVIDEFATLVEELPDFVGGLVGIAQLGRSLGVHLVLATQRPAGVVSADIKANTNLRIALRVTDPGESTDVLETKDAALISRSTPGRAYARVGTGAVTAFQSARVGGHALGATRVAATVHPVRFERYGDPVARVATPAGDGPTDLARIVGACQKAAAALAVPPGRSPWLPPLPDVLTVEEPAAVVEPAAVAATWMVPAGVSDLPRSQARAAWGLDLEHGGHLLVAGTARSGRTTVLRTIAGSIAARYGVGDVHVYAIDGASGALAPLSALPHVGAVVSRDQPSRGDRLIGRLVTELGRRQQLLAGAGFASIAEQRAATSARERLPYLVLLLDSWEGLQSAFETVDHGRPVDAIVRLVREGAAAGVRVVLTGDRSTVTSRIGSLIADRLLLRLADPADYGLAGIPTRLVPERMPPGRGLVPDGVGEILETQVALLDPEPTGHAQVAALRRIAETARRRSFDLPRERWPFRVEALPAQVGAAELAGAEEATASGPLWAFLGVGGDELEPIGVDLAEEGPGFVVAGATGSGRSTALVGIGRGMLRRGAELVLVTARRSPLRGLAGERGVLAALGPRDGPRLQEVLASAAGPFAVLVDDVEALHESGLDQPLLGLLRPPDDRPRALVVAGSSSELANQFRGVGAEARKNRLGLVLNPAGGSESDLLGTRVPRGDEARPGRGVLVHRGRLVAVQVALP